MNKVNIQGLDGKLTKIYGDECEKNVVGIVIFNKDGKFFFDSESKNQMSDEEVEALLLRGAVVDRGGKYYRPSSFNSEKVSFSDAIVNPEDIEVDLTGYVTKDELEEAIENVEVDLSDYATKAYVDSKVQTGGNNTGGGGGVTVVSPSSVLEGKSIVFFGDSITTNQNASKIYAQVLEEIVPFSKVTIQGVAGSSVSSVGLRGTQYQPLTNRYSKIPDADIITIFMGTNDWGQQVPLGTIDDITDVSFYGALNYSLLNIITAHPNATIIWITPLHRYGHGEFNGVKRTYDHIPSPLGHTLKDYVDAIKDVCERYSVPVIDLFNISNMSPSVPVLRSKYFTDGLHPNNLGHEKLAYIIKKWLDIYSADLEMNDVVVNPGEQIVYYTVTYKYVCNGASIKSNTTQSVEKGTSMTFSTSQAPTITGYEVASVSPSSATINTNTTVTYTYNINEDVVTPEPEQPEDTGLFSGYTLQIGNKYTGSNNTTRASLSPLRIDLTEGIIIKPKNGYKFGAYASGNLITNNYQTDAFTFSSGKCTNIGIVIGKVDDSDFDWSVDSMDPDDYLEILSAPEQPDTPNVYTMQLGNKYTGAGTTINRLSLNPKGIFVPEGVTVSPKAGYKWGGYKVTGVIGTTSGGQLWSNYVTTSYTAPTGGIWAGFVVGRTDDTDFDLSVDSIYASDYIDSTDPNIFNLD